MPSGCKATCCSAIWQLLDGTAIDWAERSASVVGQAILWLLLPLLLAAFGRRLVVLAARASGVLITAQLLLLAISALQPSAAEATSRPKWREPPARMFHFSSTRNIVHFVLDGFQGDVFEELAAGDEALRRELEGFVFFADHAGAFRTTSMSIPAMLTGVAYRNQTPIRGFIASHLSERSLFTVLSAHGYEVDFASITGNYFSGPIARKYFLPKPYVSHDLHRRASTAQLLDLSLFRHAPAALKKGIYNNQEWLLHRRTSAHRQHLSSNSRAFLEDLTRRMTVAGEEPVYKLIHVGIPHPPVVLDGECRFTGVVPTSREVFVDQSRCAMRSIVDFLRRLRELEIYDTSLILLTSDHGIGLPSPGFVIEGEAPDGLRRMAGRASALLAVKRPGASGPLSVSRAPSAITDIPATVLDAMGLPADLPGASAFRLDPTRSREREYANYEWDNRQWGRKYLPTLDVYVIRGPLARSSSWTPIETIAAAAEREGRRRN